ncbi:hypothetical protein PUNSTDRAFT_136982 [Punctularia strigosozonata HHB-11173 SS5]|uniref:uncharacterized protein n=1 Tax=Punctularia strigosozonata (strain HHB-11173) TaxID=741275 RepID=UPI00044164AA|nr:uncharacterized protein PUNSTDRAFT_136982 [Punctularia strigosozonata HHB-11173 SS5]EIN06194.1 hypothetical protein PUNSTDRAFT_136982 [Punctularia strigosozonata HHB-11173 SS5]
MAASACISYILEEKVRDYIIYVTRMHKRYRSHNNIFGQMADAYYHIAASRSRMPIDSGVGYLVVVAKYSDNKREPQLPPIKKEYGPLPFGCPVTIAKLVVATNVTLHLQRHSLPLLPLNDRRLRPKNIPVNMTRSSLFMGHPHLYPLIADYIEGKDNTALKILEEESRAAL